MALTVCSTAFAALGRSQASALGYSDLPIAVVPHPFGASSRSELQNIAKQCAVDIAKLISIPAAARTPEDDPDPLLAAAAATQIELPDDIVAFNRLCRERRWGDGLPLIPPTPERVTDMLSRVHLERHQVIARIAPKFGAATLELIAINAVLAGCDPDYLPVVLAAVEAVTTPQFNLQGIQVTTNPVAVWLIINGPVAKKLGVNEGINCLGQGVWANATLGRALRLILQNVGGAFPGEMDRATQGQPGKYTFCCAENEAANPWEPLHVERGFAPESGTVTVVGYSGTLNMNTHAKDAADILRVIADTMAYAPSNDYWIGGEPWIVLGPEHAEILQRAGLTKSDVKRRLWEQSRMAAGRMAERDFTRTQSARRTELGEIRPDTLLPITDNPDRIGIIVAGGPGTHSVYVSGFGSARSVTRVVTP